MPSVKVTEYVKPSPACSATYLPPPLIASEANGTGAWYGNFLYSGATDVVEYRN